MTNYDTGFNTTPHMWTMVSDALDKENLPQSVNEAIYALCEGQACIRTASDNETQHAINRLKYHFESSNAEACAGNMGLAHWHSEQANHWLAQYKHHE